MSDAKAKDGELDANVEKAESKLRNAEDIERDKPETFEAFEEIKAFNDNLNNAIDISNKYSVELEALKEKLENARLAKDESGKQLFAAKNNLYSAQKDYDDLLATRNRRPKHRAPANKDQHDEPNISKKDDKQLAPKIPENNPLVEKQNDSMGKIEFNDNAMDKPIKIDNTIKKDNIAKKGEVKQAQFKKTVKNNVKTNDTTMLGVLFASALAGLAGMLTLKRRKR